MIFVNLRMVGGLAIISIVRAHEMRLGLRNGHSDSIFAMNAQDSKSIAIILIAGLRTATSNNAATI